jgi:hypothetical protein
MTQQPDTKPGAYYTTALYNGRHALLAGPFPNHATALALVDKARIEAEKVDPRAVWYAYGTARFPETFNEPGKLNTRLINEEAQ